MRRMFVAITLALAAMTASAADPKFGGCLSAHPDTCFAPTVSVNLIAMRLKDGDVTSTFDPGLGYGVSFYTSKWYRVDASLTVAIPTLEDSRRVQPAITFAFAEYLRLGLACPLYTRGWFGENAMLTFAIGADFGLGTGK